MNYQENIFKLKKACDSNLKNLKRITENFLPLESYFLFENEAPSSECFVPNEANFQLPNIFLKTTINTACKKYIQCNEEKIDRSQIIDKLIEELETFIIDDSCDEDEDLEIIDKNILNDLYKKRYGF